MRRRDSFWVSDFFHPSVLPSFSSPSPSSPTPSQRRAGESKLWELKRLGLTFYCNSHLSQGNSLETPVIDEWCLLNWSPQIVTGKAWETVIHPASLLLWRLRLKGPLRLCMEGGSIKTCSKALKMPFLPFFFFLPWCHLQHLLAKPTYLHAGHTHTLIQVTIRSLWNVYKNKSSGVRLPGFSV